jgi:hypothetical protein
MNETGWLTFYTGAREIEQQRGVNQAEAQAKLRLACAEQKIRSMKAPYEELNHNLRQVLPFEFWTRVAPRERREREVDYDGPDDDGCPIEVMINETEFLDWLNKQQPEPAKKAVGKQPRIICLLALLYPKSVPDPGLCPRIVLRADLLRRDPSLAPLDEGTLKSAIEAYNADPKRS